MQGFGDQLFADVRAVGIGGVNEIDAELHSAAKNRDGGFAVLGRAPDAIAGEAHGAEAEPVDGELAAERDSSR